MAVGHKESVIYPLTGDKKKKKKKKKAGGGTRVSNGDQNLIVRRKLQPLHSITHGPRLPKEELFRGRGGGIGGKTIGTN